MGEMSQKAVRDFIIALSLKTTTPIHLPLNTFKMTCMCQQNIEEYQAYERKRVVLVKNRAKLEHLNSEASRKLNKLLKILDSKILQYNGTCDVCSRSRVQAAK